MFLILNINSTATLEVKAELFKTLKGTSIDAPLLILKNVLSSSVFLVSFTSGNHPFDTLIPYDSIP